MMSVIIRLQNLPWAANAADIRAYFNGLSIPEGGVHIVGGEQGDAFIAFSTDEDARQAMLLDGGKLKEVKIKLFLSSRAEMLRVIEQARQQTLNVQSIIHGTPAVPPVSTPNIINNAVNPVLPKIEEIKDEDDIKGKDDESSRERRDRYRSTSRERGRSRGRDSKDRTRGSDSRDRSRGKYRDRDRRRRDRSRSRDRHRRRSRSRDRRRNSRDRERDNKDHARNKRKDSREAEEVDKNGSNATPDEPSWDATQNQQKVPLLPDPPALPPMLMQLQTAKEVATPPAPVLNFPPQDQERRPPFPYNPQMGAMPPQAFMPMRGRDGWNPPPQMVGMMDPIQMGMPRPMVNNVDMGMQAFPPGFGMPPMFSGQNPNDPTGMWRPPMMPPTNIPEEVKSEDSDMCVEIRGLPLNASYIDVKKLFDGLSIPSDGIKMINDNHGNRTGIAYVRFNNSIHRKAALNQNGKKVRSNIVEVINLRDTIYKTAIDNFKPDKDSSLNSVDMEIDSSDNTEEAWSRERDRERDREREREKERERERERDRERDREREREREKGRSRQKNCDPRINKANIEQRDEKRSDCVVLHGLPLNCNENDIADFFDELDIIPADILLVTNGGKPVGDAFCIFESIDEAEKALNKNNAPMGSQMVSVQRSHRAEMDRVKQTMCGPVWQRPQRLMSGARPPLMPEPPYGNRMANPDRYNFEDRDPRFHDRIGTERGGRYRGENGRPPSMQRDRMPMRGRGSRGGGMDHYGMHRGGSRRGNPREAVGIREPSPYIDDNTLEHFGRPGCVVSLENLHFRAEIEEIIEFFDGFEVEHENVIRRFDDNGRPTGDARVALISPSEAVRAVRLLNFKPLRGRTVKVSIL